MTYREEVLIFPKDVHRAIHKLHVEAQRALVATGDWREFLLSLVVMGASVLRSNLAADAKRNNLVQPAAKLPEWAAEAQARLRGLKQK